MKRIGFLINPVAGIGGQAGMKGSDDQAGREDALRRGYQKTAVRRAGQCLESFGKAMKQTGREADVTFLAPEGEMGGELLKEAGLPFQTVGETRPGEVTTREDTIRFAETMKEKGAIFWFSAAAMGRPGTFPRRWEAIFLCWGFLPA